MTKKRMIYIISILTIVVGLAETWSFFLPFFGPGKIKELNPVVCGIGVLFILAGWGLFRLSEFGRELSFWLWFMSLMWSLLATVFLLPTEGGLVTSTNLPAIVFMSVWIVVNLFVVIFLEQRETKKIFVPETADDIASKRPDVIPPTSG